MSFNKKEYMKEYYQKNKQKRQVYDKEYRKKNKEKINEYKKTDENYIKSTRIGKWRNRGVISEDYNKLYEYYLSIQECENCGIELNQEGDYKTRKCLDHDHNTGLFRNILCDYCNKIRR